VRGIHPFVSEVWSQHLQPGGRHWVLPDGCVDLVFREGADADLFWVGPMTRAEIVTVDTPTHFLGLRFRPGVAPFVMGLDAREALDRDVPFDDGRLLERVLAARSDEERREVLLGGIAGRCSEPDPVVLNLSTAILESGGELRVSKLAERAGLSERTLHRRFAAGVGYGPKLLCRVARLRLAWSLGKQGRSGAVLAHEAGYFDQAHLCHDLASFGLTPADLLA
jgi:AraC-like DNA-binding protein